MTNLCNTLYVTTPGAYLKKDHENVAVRIERKTALSVPLHHLAGIVCLGRVMVSPALMYACGKAGIAISYLSSGGRFLARVEGPLQGNVLLRRMQFRLADDPRVSARFARSFIAGKVANARCLLQRGARDHGDPEAVGVLEAAVDTLKNRLGALTEDLGMDELRGHEGEAASVYFGAFDRLLHEPQRKPFRLDKRTRRPPLDPMNALLSFLYAIVTHDAASALQAVGLDPSVGYRHGVRPRALARGYKPSSPGGY